MDQRLKITLIGAGNVATHLGRALGEVADINAVYSRNLHNATSLASELGEGVIATDSLSNLPTDSDIYIISVVDDAIRPIVEATAYINGGIWAHTSGSTPMEVFAGVRDRYGVFYPLQTFSKTKMVDVRQVPMLIEGSSPEVASILYSLAEGISKNVRYVDSKGREHLHIAAVFACNFVNYMWTQADSLLRPAGLDISVLMPLLEETLDKMRHVTPYEGQTGPARRGDLAIIEKHLRQLSDPHQHQLYEIISEQILHLYQPNIPSHTSNL